MVAVKLREEPGCVTFIGHPIGVGEDLLDFLLVEEVAFVSVIIVENEVHFLVFLVSERLKVAIFTILLILHFVLEGFLDLLESKETVVVVVCETPELSHIRGVESEAVLLQVLIYLLLDQFIVSVGVYLIEQLLQLHSRFLRSIIISL